MQKENKKSKSKIIRFASYYRPHLGTFILDMTCALIISLIDVFYPLVSNYVLKTLLPEATVDDKKFSLFFLIVALAIIIHIVRAFLQYIVTFIGHRLGLSIETDMRRDVFVHLQKQPFSFYDRSRTGHLISRCTNDLFDITELAHHGPEDLFISVVTIIGSFIVMFAIEWRLAILLALFVPIMLIFVILLRKRMSRTSKRVKQSVAVINAGIESSISGARAAKAFANEEYEINKFDAGNKVYFFARSEYYKSMGMFMGGMELFTSILKVFVLGLGGYLIMMERMDMVALLTFSLYVSSFVSPIRKLAMFAEQYVVGMAGFERFTETMDIEPTIVDEPDAVELDNVRGSIEFKNVCFAYNNDQNVLSNLNLTVKAGSKLALVGPSGGGKTTICHLIPRFYEVESGSINIDGKDIRDVTMASLRRNIGIVQQDVIMFADTIRENIRYGDLNATDEDIVRAAKAAEIHDDIMGMPNGYDTIVGERGITLSGGQKQRISIARIFLKNPPILILDEATSALDSATEARITGAFDRLSEGRTTIMIAHRLSTIRNADEIAVIEDEGIVEYGTHDELMKLRGEYYKLRTAQVE